MVVPRIELAELGNGHGFIKLKRHSEEAILRPPLCPTLNDLSDKRLVGSALFDTSHSADRTPARGRHKTEQLRRPDPRRLRSQDWLPRWLTPCSFRPLRQDIGQANRLTALSVGWLQSKSSRALHAS